jgi:hypothetical protein
MGYLTALRGYYYFIFLKKQSYILYYFIIADVQPQVSETACSRLKSSIWGSFLLEKLANAFVKLTAYASQTLHRNVMGPEAVHLGSNEVSDSLGCSWLGVVRGMSAQHPGFRLTNVVRLFGTTTVSALTTLHTSGEP